MSYELNKKIRELEPYEPISGTYKIRLDANECPENYPDFIKEEIKNAIDTIDFNRYPDPLAEKVVTAFADYYGINPKYVTAGNGSDELIFLIEAAFMEKGTGCFALLPIFQCTNSIHQSVRLNVTHLSNPTTFQLIRMHLLKR